MSNGTNTHEGAERTAIARRGGGSSTGRSPRRRLRRWTALLITGALTGAFCVVGFAAPVQAGNTLPVDLGALATFGVLSPGAVGNAANVAGSPPTMIRGDVGHGGALTGFSSNWGVITGTTYAGPAAIAPFMTDLEAAYADAKGREATLVLGATLAGGNFGPGVHSSGAAATGTAAGGTFTIDGGGDPDAVFIFQVGGALALGANTTMTLIGEAQAKNVFWAVNGAGGLGADTKFVGTLMAGTAISSGAGSTVNGRLLSRGGAVTMGATQLYSGAPTISIYGNTAGQPATTASTTTSSPVISGTTSARSPMTVSISIDGVTQTTTLAPSATGAWSFQAPLLANGLHTIIVSSVDGANNKGSYTQILNVDTTPPEVGIDGGASATTNDLTPTISGTTDIAAGQPVRITITNTVSAASVTRTTLVQDDLTWNISPNGLSAGTWTVVARVVDPAGNASTATQTLFIDATAPPVAITSSALTNDPTPMITGTTESGASVVVHVDGVAVAGVTVTGSTWTAQTTTALGHGTHHLSVAATDSAGNTTSPAVTQSLVVDLVLPIVGINPGATDATNDRTPTIVGTTDVTPGPGVIVLVSIDGGAALSALVQPDGWNVTPSAMLSVGNHTIVARVADPAGNIGTFTQTLTVDVAAPSVTITGGPSRTTTDATPTIAGSSPDVAVGSPVTVTINGQTLTTTISAAGTFAVTAATIPNGTHFAFVTVTDAAGNTGNANQALTVNAIPPTVTFDGGQAASTNDATPRISGTTNAATGTPVVVSVDGQTLHATVQPGGSWNVTAAHIDNGPFTITTEITDGSGNIGTATQVLTIAEVARRITIDGGTAAATNDDTPTVSGSTNAADGRTMTVTVGGQTWTTTVVGGLWSIDAAHLIDGEYDVTASVSSADGTAAGATQTLTIDTVAPIVEAQPPVQTTDPTPPITGDDATPGSAVSVTVAGQTMTTTVAPHGTWSVTPPNALPVGSNEATITITDPAGNTGAGTRTITVNREPAATTITISGGATKAINDATPTISGVTNAVDGRLITVAIDGQTLTTTATSGTWSLTATHVNDGTYNVNAAINSDDGSPAATSQSLTIDTLAPDVFVESAASTTDSTPTISGSATLGAHVSVAVDGQTMTTTAAGSGTWTVTPPDALPTGEHSVRVTATDSAGNTAFAVQALTVSEPPPTTTTPTTTTPPTTTTTTTPPTTTPTPTSAPPTTSPPAVETPESATAAAISSIGPLRVFDTRAGQSPNAIRDVAERQVGNGYELEVRMTDLAGYVPAIGVGAVSLNVVSTGSRADGFLTVYACGARELVSSVNFAEGRTVGNAVIAPLSANGTVCFYANTPTDIIVDINGWLPAGAAFTSVGPKRVLDTRAGNSPDALRDVAETKIAAGGTLEVRLTDLAGYVPAVGVGSVSLNVAVTNPEAAGFVTVYSCGTRALVSSVNYARGQTVANAVLAPVSPSGTVCFYSYAATDLIVDINGWVETGSGFTGVNPARILDTRAGNSPDALRDVAEVQIGTGSILEVKVTDLGDIVPGHGVTAVSLNVTATNTAADGFITVFACGKLEEVASVNFGAGATVANAVIAPVSATGSICLYSNVRTDVVVDINGWFGSV